MKNNLRNLKLTRFSAVASPAQKGARAVLLKSSDGPAPDGRRERVQKYSDLLTGETKGHQHGVSIGKCYCPVGKCDCGLNGFRLSVGFYETHSHPIAKDAEGKWVIGMVHDHTHDIDSELLQTRIDEKLNMKEEGMTKQAPEKEAVDTAKVSAELEKLRKVVALPAEQKAHYDGLDAAAADAFLGKSGEARALEMRAKQEADPVVYRCKATGEALRKSAGAERIAMAKRLDVQQEQIEMLTKANETARLEKMIREEMPHLPNEGGALPALVKAAEEIGPEAVNVLKGASASMGGLFRTAGVSGVDHVTVQAGDPLPEGQAVQKTAGVALEEKVEALMKAENLSRHEAMLKFGRTPEGRNLRARIDAEKPVVTEG
ncbi:MAG: hypothetical protein F4X14_20185 [Caldilineaceae bacterium SB0661_bin_32]|uniref:Uncharacterized protein n=1 Tax=Caldilineaceae bacterium SB0661_bin_32 TaxID=2605255 RepID=A0A6B1DD09_9CHLR|nr:hypothetical protein [Caldilineaceae bacterium SB0661_bin_32]